MTESTSSAQPPGDPAESPGAERFHLKLAARGILLALALAAVVLRLHHLDEIPPGFGYDEGTHALDALRVLQGEHAVFFTENTGRPGLIVYAIALSTSLFGRTMLALRLPTAPSQRWHGHCCLLAGMVAF